MNMDYYAKDVSRMTIEQLKSYYDRELRAQLQKQIDQIPRIVDEAVKGIVNEVVGRTLGISRDAWGKWETRYTRSGDGTKFVDLIQEAADKYVDDNAEKLVKTFITKIHKEDTEPLKEAYKEEVYNAFYSMMSEKAKEEATTIFKKLTGKSKSKEAEE